MKIDGDKFISMTPNCQEICEHESYMAAGAYCRQATAADLRTRIIYSPVMVYESKVEITTVVVNLVS